MIEIPVMIIIVRAIFYENSFFRWMSLWNINNIKMLYYDRIDLVVIRSLLVKKKDLNTLSATKMLEKIDLYIYFSQKWVHIEKTLMKLICHFW